MTDFKGIVRPPTISDVSFNCPHCGALAKQYWYNVRAESLKDDCHPNWLSKDKIRELAETIKDEEAKHKFVERQELRNSKRPMFVYESSSFYTCPIENINISRCYNCKQIGVWFGDGIVWPARGSVSPPNSDMPEDALSDYEEAAKIVDNSPRGAAALLRLAIQKICLHLGGKGKNINDDIATFVKNGLDPRVQQALDVVRVVGNNAVHPGEMDIRDDRQIADNLFNLINLIVDIMISQPNHVSNMFSNLPQRAKDAIVKRDG